MIAPETLHSSLRGVEGWYFKVLGMRDLGISRDVFLITLNTCLECPHLIVTAPIPATAKRGGWAFTDECFRLR